MNDSADYVSCIPSKKRVDFNLDGVLEQMEEDEKNLSDESDNEEGVVIRREIVRGNDVEYSRLEGGETSHEELREEGGENGLVTLSESSIDAIDSSEKDCQYTHPYNTIKNRKDYSEKA